MRRHIDELTKKIMAIIALRSTVRPRKTADYLGVALLTVYAVVRKARLTSQVVSMAQYPGRLRIFNALDLNVGDTRLKAQRACTKSFSCLKLRSPILSYSLDSYTLSIFTVLEQIRIPHRSAMRCKSPISRRHGALHTCAPQTHANFLCGRVCTTTTAP
jgi:hypothetical protein